MNQKAINTLEFPKIVAALAERAAFSLGKQQCLALEPMTDLWEISLAQKETTAATGLILRKGSLPLGGISDIRPAIRRAMAGGMLVPQELLGVSDSLYVCRKVLSYGKDDQNPEAVESPLADYFNALEGDDDIENEITKCIKHTGEIADNASPKLSDIRRQVRVAHDKVRDHLQKIIHSTTYKNMLQDSIVTLRGDRFCVPVKAEFRGSFQGMVHDQSSTGATVFMEPLSVVELNNKIKDLHFEEKREEERILYKLSDLVGQRGEVLDANLKILTHLDFVFAKGEMSLSMEANEPIFNDRGYVNIRKGRHPLLNRDTVVPTDVTLGGEFHMLLITGPNTGGKTVSLKTVGLFHLMGQAGLHIPALDNSELAVFEEVFADIGDEQSIEQSLSTFSSHMTNIVSILENLNTKALVLLDELGAGTDPTEGAALAIALLGHLHQRGIHCVVTTHYSELKLYALSTDGVENASCEFDVETLKPTYRLIIGIPGKSNAFSIARRLGLSGDIIESAKTLLSQKDIRFEDVITDLEASKKAVLMEQERAEVLRREASKLQADVSKQEERLKQQKEKILNQAREEAMEVVHKAKRESERLLKSMRAQMERASQKELEEARKQAKEKLAELEVAVAPTEEKPKHTPPENLRRGDRVFIHSMRQHGVVSEPPDASGELLLQAGIMKIKVHISDTSLDDSEPMAKSFKQDYSSSGRLAKSLSVNSEIHVRGMMPEEALILVEKYLDDAFLSGLNTVRIVHGKGTGTLKGVIQTMLKKHPHVKEYRLGRYGEGEAGVTVVSLK